MKTAIYIRFSTNDQSESQQMNTINDYLDRQRITADLIVKDEGVSGGVSYADRKLINLLDELSEGDLLVVSEISRLGRSMCDLNKLVNDELKPRKLKLVVIKMGLDLDCSQLKAIDEMILQSFAFAAQVEKELIQERTQSALDAKKRRGEPTGGDYRVWNKNSGMTEEESKAYREDVVLAKARKASAKAAKRRSETNPNNVAFKFFMLDIIEYKGPITATTDWEDIAKRLNERNLKTATGLEFTPLNARSMWHNNKHKILSNL